MCRCLVGTLGKTLEAAGKMRMHATCIPAVLLQDANSRAEHQPSTQELPRHTNPQGLLRTCRIRRVGFVVANFPMILM